MVAFSAWYTGETAAKSTSTKSRLALPALVVAEIRIVFEPAFTVAVTDFVVQVSQLAVGSNGAAAAITVPSTLMSAGRLAVVPLAYRIPTVAVPALAALTAHCRQLPTALSLLTQPAPL